jgi:hypothetical protein
MATKAFITPADVLRGAIRREHIGALPPKDKELLNAISTLLMDQTLDPLQRSNRFIDLLNLSTRSANLLRVLSQDRKGIPIGEMVRFTAKELGAIKFATVEAGTFNNGFGKKTASETAENFNNVRAIMRFL